MNILKRQELSNKIQVFLSNFAKKTVDGKYSSPDASSLESFSFCLLDKDFNLKDLIYPHSEFWQGGYKLAGEEEHEQICNEINNFMNPECPNCQVKNEIKYHFCYNCGKKLED